MNKQNRLCGDRQRIYAKQTVKHRIYCPQIYTLQTWWVYGNPPRNREINQNPSAITSRLQSSRTVSLGGDSDSTTVGKESFPPWKTKPHAETVAQNPCRHLRQG